MRGHRQMFSTGKGLDPHDDGGHRDVQSGNGFFLFLGEDRGWCSQNTLSLAIGDDHQRNHDNLSAEVPTTSGASRNFGSAARKRVEHTQTHGGA